MKRILIIEDEIALLTGLQDNLEFEGYEVITASKWGIRFVRLSAKKKPDLVLLDIILPPK